MYAFPAGVYEHECPGCGKVTHFSVTIGPVSRARAEIREARQAFWRSPLETAMRDEVRRFLTGLSPGKELDS